MITNEQYEKALARAKAENLEITDVTYGPVTVNVHVHNPKNGTGYYTVRLDRSMKFSCNCQAGQQSVLCKHVAFAREHLLAHKAEIRRAWGMPEPTPVAAPAVVAPVASEQTERFLLWQQGVATYNYTHGRGSKAWRD